MKADRKHTKGPWVINPEMLAEIIELHKFFSSHEAIKYVPSLQIRTEIARQLTELINKATN